MSNHYYSEGSRDDKINRLEDVTNDLFNDDTSGINDILSIIVKGIIPSFLRILKECIDHHNHLNDSIADTVVFAVTSDLPVGFEWSRDGRIGSLALFLVDGT